MSDINKIFYSNSNRFINAISEKKKLPDMGSLPEIAVVGKSNVGKSSLINALVNRKSLARASHTPGRTRQINFFSIGEKFILSDLPGYGYAKVSHSEKEKWDVVITHYLEKSKFLKKILVLIDSRRGIKENDQMILDWLEDKGIPVLLVLTKCDQIKKQDKLTLEEELKNYQNKIFVSSRDKIGINELQQLILDSL